MIKKKTTCRDCQECIKGCPTNTLVLVQGIPRKIHKEQCIACDFCLNICPDKPVPVSSPQNIYDNEEFHNKYQEMRKSPVELNQVLEQPAIKSLLPSCNNISVVDLGCGNGQLCKYLVEQGADKVIGVDISKKMLKDAVQSVRDNRVTFIQSSIEDFETEHDTHQLVVSSLAFHYLPDLNSIFKKINSWIQTGGYLVFSMEHPIITCSHGIHQGWHKNAEGEKKYWPVDVYSYEGMRKSHWFVDGVIRYHRQFSSLLNTLIENGFTLERVLEPHAVEQAERERPFLLEERRRPSFMAVKARKTSEPSP